MMRNTVTHVSWKAGILILVFFSLFLGACTDFDLDPIFWTLANEVALEDDKGFEDSVTVFRVVSDGANYYAAANQVYYRPEDESADWQGVDPPEPGALCNTIEYYSITSNIVAGFYDSLSGDGLGLWKLLDGATSSWQQVSDVQGNLTNTDRYVLIKEVNNKLFIATDSKSLFYSSDQDNFYPVIFDETLNFAVTDITGDPAGPTYYVATGYKIFTGTAASVTRDNDAVLDTGAPYAGIYFAGQKGASGTVYASSRDGILYTYDVAATAWATSGVDSIEADGDTVPFTQFLEIDPAGSTSDIFVGTAGYGYYVLPAGDITASVVVTNRSPNYNISEMYKGVILSFYKEPGAADNPIFACTVGSGLWRADYLASAWVWKQE